MGTVTVNLAQAVAGLMAVEKRIIELADERKIGGLRFEWNDGQDFGHLEDPMPVSIFAPRGKALEAEFPLEELARFPAGSRTSVDAKIDRVVQAFTEEG